MIAPKQMARIKRYLGWEHKPDGAVEALVEMIHEAEMDSVNAETAEELDIQGLEF